MLYVLPFPWSSITGLGHCKARSTNRSFCNIHDCILVKCTSRLTWASGSFTAGFGKRAAELSRWFHDGFNHHVNDKGIVKSNNNDYSSIGNKSNCIAIERRPAAATMKIELSAVAAIAAAALLGDSFELQCLVPVAEAGSEQTYAKERKLHAVTMRCGRTKCYEHEAHILKPRLLKVLVLFTAKAWPKACC